MGFSKQEYWAGLPCPPPRDLSDPGIEPASPVSPELQADSLPAEPSRKPEEKYHISETSPINALALMKAAPAH